MPYFTYDTSVCISRKLTDFTEMPQTHARKRSQKGILRRLPHGASQRMALDVLIAVSARRWNATVVTENWVDFKAIQRYCNVTILRGSKFFGK
jgi:hypothetical protein